MAIAQDVFSSKVRGSALLNTQDIFAAVDAVGLELRRPVVSSISRYYQQKPGLSFQNFLDLLIDVAILKSNFERIDKDLRGVIVVDLDQLTKGLADISPPTNK